MTEFVGTRPAALGLAPLPPRGPAPRWRRQHRIARLVGCGLPDPGAAVDLLRIAAARGRRAEADHRGSRHATPAGGAGRFADLARHRARRHRHGPGRRAHRHPRHGHVRRDDDRARPRHLGDRQSLGDPDRPHPAGRPSRQRRAVSAADRLCQPLVRPPARHRAGADLVRPIHRRHGLADPVRIGMRSPDTALHLGGDTVMLHGWQTTMLGFACRRADRGADRRAVSEAAARSGGVRRLRRARGGAATSWACGRTRRWR